MQLIATWSRRSLIFSRLPNVSLLRVPIQSNLNFGLCSIEVRVGEHNWKDKAKDGIDHKIKSFVIHPKYKFLTKQTVQFDFGVATLEKPVTLSHKVRLACLPSPDLNVQGKIAKISGWGSIVRKKGKAKPSHHLKVANVTVLSDKECKKESPVYQKDNMMCTRDEKGLGVCGGDSGGNSYIRTLMSTCDKTYFSIGPLNYQDHDGKWLVVGIVSFTSTEETTKKCGDGGATVFAKVQSELDWIKSQL